MLNPSEIPSLSECLDRYLTAEVVTGKVENADYRVFYTFSLSSDEVASMTAQELFMLYLQPIIEKYFAPAINTLGRVCTKAMPLPGEKDKVIGFRCWQGKIPVNIYIARRMNPDRHQYIVEAMVYPAPSPAPGRPYPEGTDLPQFIPPMNSPFYTEEATDE